MNSPRAVLTGGRRRRRAGPLIGLGAIAIVTAGAMILQDEGRLVISDPVGMYLPEFLKTTVAVADGPDSISRRLRFFEGLEGITLELVEWVE